MKQGSSSIAQSLPINSNTVGTTGERPDELPVHAPADVPTRQAISPNRSRSPWPHNVEYVRFRSRQPAESAITRKNTCSTQQSQPNLQRAQAMAHQVLKEKLASRPLPQTIQALLQESWSQVMLRAYQQNDGGQRWYESIGSLDELTWCLQPHTETKDRQRWVRIVPLVLKQIRQGLEEAGIPRATLDRQLMELKRALSRTFRQQSISAAEQALPPVELAPVKTEAASHLPARTKSAVERLEEREKAAYRECQNHISSIAPGDILELTQVSGKIRRYRLRSRSIEEDLYIFSSRTGLRTLRKTGAELVHEMLRGRLRILEQGSPATEPAAETAERHKGISQALA